jgi:hypothetical protein
VLNVQQAWKSFPAHPMVLLGANGQVEARFETFGDNINLDAREFHGLCRMYHGHGNHFEHTRWYVKWKLVSVYLEIVLVSTQDRSMVLRRTYH